MANPPAAPTEQVAQRHSGAAAAESQHPKGSGPVPAESRAVADAGLPEGHEAIDTKKDSGIASVTYHEALEVALCYGRIDGQNPSDDAQFWLQKFTPRAKRSFGSKVNRKKIAVLTAAGRLHPAGLREVQRAQSDGRREAAYDSARTATVPDNFMAALNANPGPPKRSSPPSMPAIAMRYSSAYKPPDAPQPAISILYFAAMLEQGRTMHLT